NISTPDYFTYRFKTDENDEYPNKANISAEDITQIQRHLPNETNPIIKAILYDFIWTFSKPKNVNDRTEAIKYNLVAMSVFAGRSFSLDFSNHCIRALFLATQTNDPILISTT